MDNEKLKENVLNVLKQYPNGVYQKTLNEKIPHLVAEDLLFVIKDLVANSQIETVKLKSSKELYFKLKDSTILLLEKKLKQDEASVNRLIRDAGSKGVSPQIIKRTTKLKESEITKIEKRLIDIGLIKLFYFNGQKIYVAIDTVPDSTLSEKLFVMGDKNSSESKIIELQKCVLDFMKMKHKRAVEQHQLISEQQKASIATLENITNGISGNFDKKITSKEMRLILDSLVYSDDLVQLDHSFIVKDQSSMNFSENFVPNYVYRYKASKQKEKLESVAAFPCVLCPHKEYCSPGNKISPEQCVYLDQFLNCF